jgi:hypothetical protein
MIFIFDRQHYGKPNKSDMGARFDLDGDGQIETHELEANLTPLYYLPAKQFLEARGHTVVIFDSGWYEARHERANALARANPTQRVAYLACHVNASRGDYAAFIHDQRSRGGEALAEALAAAVRARNLPGIRRTLVRSATPTNDWKRGLATIGGIFDGPPNISGNCVEPYFLDRKEHSWLATEEGGRAIGETLGHGLLAWAGA